MRGMESGIYRRSENEGWGEDIRPNMSRLEDVRPKMAHTGGCSAENVPERGYSAENPLSAQPTFGQTWSGHVRPKIPSGYSAELGLDQVGAFSFPFLCFVARFVRRVLTY